MSSGWLAGRGRGVSVKITPESSETEKPPLVSMAYLTNLLDLYGYHRLVLEPQNTPEFSGFGYSRRRKRNLFFVG